IGKRAMTGSRLGPEELRERGEPGARYAPFEQPSRQSDRVDDCARDPCAGQTFGLTIEEGEIETRVVGNKHRVARESEEALHRSRCARRAAKLGVSQARQGADRGANRDAGIDERLELVLEL